MLESFQKNKKGILLMLVSSICVCVGQLLWKLSATQGIIVMLAGFCFYGVGALVMIIAYKYGKLSVLQPMLSLQSCNTQCISGSGSSERTNYIIKEYRCPDHYCGCSDLIAGGDEE